MTHHEPNIHGMGAYEGLRSGALLQQKLVRHAKQAVHDLDDAALVDVIAEELRRRPSVARGIQTALRT